MISVLLLKNRQTLACDESAVPKGAAAGDRYAAEQMRALDGER
jgi:hypothetical protein